MIGSTLGPYEIQRQLGVGGIGEVYLAEDARLGRKVAIKVLPAQFASDAERLARFEQEARAAAALNHPNIAVVHDIGAEMGDDDTVHFIVQEALEGQSLSERLTGGPIPMEEALRYATGLADGLAAAHVAGVVHRDLKPDNVFLTQDGHIKILDFGLAKLTQADPAGGGSGSMSMSPTSLGTVAGQPMGTAAFMSPEQARGETVDQRTDVWAFGVVLFEMLTGERLFRADSISDTVAAVLRDPIDLAKLPKRTPHEVRRLLGRCLERDARRRLHHLADARIEIEDALSSGPLGAASSGAARSGASADSTATAPPPTTATTRPLWTRALSWIGLVALGVVIATAFEPDPSGNATDPSSMRLTVHLSPGMGLDTGGGRAVVISSDGSRLAFVAGNQLYVRFLDRREARPLAQDNNAIMPFFSPDGEWIGFFTGREMKKVSVSGGTPLAITTVPQPRGGAWVGDTIVYAPDTVGGLWTIAADGSGDPTPLTTLEGEERSHRWPSPMGDEHIVFAAQTTGRTYGESTIKVASLRDGVVHEVHNGGAFPAYAASGHLLLIQESTLFAAPFDLDSLMVTGPITPVVQGVLAQSGGEQVHNGSAQYVVSDNGTLVYSPDLGFGADRAMFYVDDDGDRERVPQEPRAYASPRFSPDGR